MRESYKDMSDKKQKRNHLVLLGYTVATIILLAVAVRYYEFFVTAYQDPDVTKELISGLGPLGPIALILAQIFQVMPDIGSSFTGNHKTQPGRIRLCPWRCDDFNGLTIDQRSAEW